MKTKEELEARRTELDQYRDVVIAKLKPLNAELEQVETALASVDNELAALICPLKVDDVVEFAASRRGIKPFKIVAIYGIGERVEVFEWLALAYPVKKDGTNGERSVNVYDYHLESPATKVNGKLWNGKAEVTV
jgi:hypothetical protein